ncbi:MAG TPA: hypothetical protein C5S37_09530 [Methanophagales archaeon]|nr:hypothetical protein [Methanophagales archaeon]
MKKAKIGIGIVLVCLVLSSAIVMAAVSNDLLKVSVKDKNNAPSLYLDPFKENVNISLDEAKTIVESEIPATKDASAQGGLIYDKFFGKKCWQLSFKTKDGKHISAYVSADTGELIYFWDVSKMSSMEGQNLTIDRAKRIASDYLKSTGGELNFSGVIYNPAPEEELAAKYDVHYSRMIKGVSCLSDRVTICVNSETGEIVSYYKVWTIPEEKIGISSVPTVSKKDAETILKNYMSRELSTEINVLSTKLIWMDMNYPVPPNGSNDIRLAWWIEFDDSYIRSFEDLPCPAAAWIDAHSGEVLRLVYDVG